jgi:hypothetical protein
MKHTCHTRRVFYSVMFFENVFSTLWWLFDELVKKDKNTLSRLLRNTCHTHITRITHITLFFINGLSRRGFIRGLCFFCVICVMCVMLISPPKNHIPDKHVTHTLCSTLWRLMWRVCDKLVFYSVISLCGEFCSPKNVPPFYYKILILFYCLFGGVYSFSFGIGVFWIFSEKFTRPKNRWQIDPHKVFSTGHKVPRWANCPASSKTPETFRHDIF